MLFSRLARPGDKRRTLLRWRLPHQQGIAEGAMADPSEDPTKLPPGLLSTGDPVSENPFLAYDLRHKVWEDATRAAEIEVADLNSGLTKAATPEPQNFLACMFTLVTAKFDIWARRGIAVVWSDSAVRGYDRWLFNYAESWLAVVREEACPPFVRADAFLNELRLRLISRVEYWKAEARRYVTLQNAHRESLPAEDATSERPATALADETDVGQSIGVDEIRAKRRSLLEEYKAATGNPSNKRIYEAKNSGIHKPDFYAWLNGDLSSESAMSINFERFLRLKKVPIPRKPKD
jgi:hypothetical protein